MRNSSIYQRITEQNKTGYPHSHIKQLPCIRSWYFHDHPKACPHSYVKYPVNNMPPYTVSGRENKIVACEHFSTIVAIQVTTFIAHILLSRQTTGQGRQTTKAPWQHRLHTDTCCISNDSYRGRL